MKHLKFLKESIVYFKLFLCLSLPFVIVLVIIFSGCQKMLDIGPPISTITTEQVFEDSANAAGGISGLYLSLRNSGIPTFSSGMDSRIASLMSDEINDFTTNGTISPFFTNEILPNNSDNTGYWSRAYSIIYQANACVEAIEASSGIPDHVKTNFLGEARFVRAWCYFYLVNFYGGVPLILSTDWKSESVRPRASVDEIYKMIIVDLQYSFSNLGENYKTPGREHTRANKWAAAAMLARVYLYRNNWELAEQYATLVLDQANLYKLEPKLEDVFLRASKEQILHLSLDTRVIPGNATNFFIFLPSNFAPRVFLTQPLLTDFEAADQRKEKWVGETTAFGTTYHYPYKYKIRSEQAVIGTIATEYFTMIRLAEMYLIRAEARANLNDLDGAIADTNVIRTRAGLPELVGLGKEMLLNAILHERRIEFFAEWGHRWFDLKRTGRADVVLAAEKPKWKTTAQLLPIPFAEMQRNVFLKQNPGY